ncbi:MULTISPECIES: hypothetical protein [Acutalibacteraceae]|uniref:hypothetical protein n=1 Tax=Acutalibacteraceae TaxID=3082771 RepID=UPI0013E8AADE|nr:MULTISPECIES: hypothetical protein [Acutalibacteraceae]
MKKLYIKASLEAACNLSGAVGGISSLPPVWHFDWNNYRIPGDCDRAMKLF